MEYRLWPNEGEQWPEEWLQRYVAMESHRLGLLFHGDGNGANKGKFGGNKMKLAGARAGWPDLVYIFSGRIVFIELKTMVGKLSAEQKAVHRQMIDMGHEVWVVHGLDGTDVWNKVRGILCV